MAKINLELIAYQGLDYYVDSIVSLPLEFFIHKRIERFSYLQHVRDWSVPISYIENIPINSRDNLFISDRSSSISANSIQNKFEEGGLVVFTGSSYASQYKSIVITNKTYVDSKGKERPLFYKHRLGDNITSCTIEVVRDGNRTQVKDDYVIDLTSGYVYTNHLNSYNKVSQSYSLFYINYVDVNGVSTRGLLNPEPVVHEASWEDIDLDTGLLKDTYPTYSKVDSGTGYTYHFSIGSKWYIKPNEDSLIHIRKPVGVGPTEPWHLRFTNGDVIGFVNGKSRRYRIPEFQHQPFSPYAPLIFNPKNTMKIVNKKVLMASRGNLKIDPDSNLHLEIRIFDVDGILIKVLTTDSTKDGKVYSTTGVNYTYGEIGSWDNIGGFVHLKLGILRSWYVEASFYYEATDFELRTVNLNPLSNKKMLEHTYVYYLIPDVADHETALHYFVVDELGFITEASQAASASYPNFKLLNIDNSFNTDTLIGTKYYSIDSECFITKYSADNDNDYGYMIIAEVSAGNLSRLDKELSIDVRRSGNSISDNYVDALKLKPNLVYSSYGYGAHGIETPENGVMIVDAPLSLLSDYGGKLNQEEAEALIRTHSLASGYTHIRWDYPNPELTATSSSGEISLEIEWVGPYDYEVYKSDTSLVGEWTLITTLVNPARADIIYLDTNVIIGETYHYKVIVVDGDISYPETNVISVEAF